MNHAILCTCALALDAVLGDPAQMPHPVVIMGGAIERLEKQLRKRLPQTPRGELWGGRALSITMVGATLALSHAVLRLSRRVHPLLAGAFEIGWGWQGLAMRDLWQEANNVHDKLLDAPLEEARSAVGRIVGRDTSRLNVQGVTKAAVESVAESFSDGIVSPMLHLYIGGAPLALAYKAINTMDSMVGYKNDTYLHFGRAAARLDDVANYVPSRIAALLLVAAARLSGNDAHGAWRIWRRDNRNHDSPNSAQTESAMAGALGIELGGPAWYFGILHNKPTIGDATREPCPDDISRANNMMLVGSVLCLGLCCALDLARHAVVRRVAR